MTYTKTINGHPFRQFISSGFTETDFLHHSKAFFEKMNTRRSIRQFSDRDVPREVIENLIRTAATAPSGAHKQPWTFCAVSDPAMKKKIREAAEQEEYISYNGRMSNEWLSDLAPFGTDWHKPFLETAPWLIAIFRHSYEAGPDGQKHSNYYVTESVGIATGFLLSAIHHAGLVALTHTPSPMNFLANLLQRPANEKPFLLVPVGYAAEDCWVPDIERKSLEKVSQWYVQA